MLARQRQSPVLSCGHGYQALMATRGLGAYARRGAGVHPRARSARRHVGDHRGALAGHGPAVDRAGAARLAHLLAAAVERSAVGHRQAATARAQGASAWQAARPRGATPRFGADRAGGGGDPDQARAMLALSASWARGRGPTPTPSRA